MDFDNLIKTIKDINNFGKDTIYIFKGKMF